MKALFTLAQLSISLGAFSQERIALVIGNGDYQINPLANTLNDAQDISKALEGLDFQVTLVENADKRTRKDAIYEFSESLNKLPLACFIMQVMQSNTMVRTILFQLTHYHQSSS